MRQAKVEVERGSDAFNLSLNLLKSGGPDELRRKQPEKE
jgi:hypothetical protein